MSDLSIARGGAGRAPSGPALFRPLTLALLLGVGILGFAATLVLGAFAPDLRSGRNGGAHALSGAATGYAAIVELARATGRNPQIIRSDGQYGDDDLLVLTPETGRADMTKILGERQGLPTLVVLPKWDTAPDPDVRGWVRLSRVTPAYNPAGVLAPATVLGITRTRAAGQRLTSVNWAPRAMRFAAPRLLQTIVGKGLQPLITDARGRVVLGQLGDSTTYVLADPDLLSNQGMADVGQARAALAMLDFLNSNRPESVGFDVTLNGLGHSPSPLKLMFQPPFLAMTLAIAVALLLAGWQASVRFGAPRPRPRAIAFGKAALIDNAAALVRKAGREAMLGARYADTVRERAVVAFGVPARLQGTAVDEYLDKLGGDATFSDLARAAGDADTRDDMLSAARRLHQWQMEKTQ